jgi:hypothetical protein
MKQKIAKTSPIFYIHILFFLFYHTEYDQLRLCAHQIAASYVYYTTQVMHNIPYLSLNSHLQFLSKHSNPIVSHLLHSHK